MNKLAKYLNQHLVGEVLVDSRSRVRHSGDAGPLSVTPEMVALPRETNDIRKLMRFAWQLAQKGHRLPMSPRGHGTASTGSSLSEGVSISLTNYMDQIFEIDQKQKLIRLQPGVSLGSLRSALRLQGLDLPNLRSEELHASIGGFMAESSVDRVGGFIDQLEVVLANGDIIHTRKQSKKDLNRIKGKQTLEADIYRGVETLLEDHKALIDTLPLKSAGGYASLRDIRGADGSINLTPLFLGSQGTLGVISELIVKAGFAAQDEAMIIARFDDAHSARDVLDKFGKVAPSRLEYYDRASIARAERAGKVFSWMSDASQDAVALVAYINEPSDRARQRKLKKLVKIFEQAGAKVVSTDSVRTSNLVNVVSIASLEAPTGYETPIKLFEGAHIPLARFEDFARAVKELSQKRNVELPLQGEPLSEYWWIRPNIDTSTVSGKQLVIKLVSELAQLAAAHGGYISGAYGEGQLQAFSSSASSSAELAEINKKLKDIFDPEHILSPDVKTQSDFKKILSMLR